MNAFDRPIMLFLNQFAHKSWFFDEAVAQLVGNNLFKGGLLVAVLWGLWFTGGDRGRERIRKLILVTFLGTFAGLFVTRVLVNVLPFRPRPIHDPRLPFVLPYGVATRSMVDHAMSFPSDHATMFFGLATGIFLISRRLGVFFLFVVFLTTALLRVYQGYHYPTDVIAGGIIGTVAVVTANTSPARRLLVDRIYRWSQEYPRLFYGLFFVVSYQSATLFADSRTLGAQTLKFLKLVAGRLG